MSKVTLQTLKEWYKDTGRQVKDVAKALNISPTYLSHINSSRVKAGETLKEAFRKKYPGYDVIEMRPGEEYDEHYEEVVEVLPEPMPEPAQEPEQQTETTTEQDVEKTMANYYVYTREMVTVELSGDQVETMQEQGAFVIETDQLNNVISSFLVVVKNISKMIGETPKLDMDAE